MRLVDCARPLQELLKAHKRHELFQFFLLQHDFELDGLGEVRAARTERLGYMACIMEGNTVKIKRWHIRAVPSPQLSSLYFAIAVQMLRNLREKASHSLLCEFVVAHKSVCIEQDYLVRYFRLHLVRNMWGLDSEAYPAFSWEDVNSHKNGILEVLMPLFPGVHHPPRFRVHRARYWNIDAVGDFDREDDCDTEDESERQVQYPNDHHKTHDYGDMPGDIVTSHEMQSFILDPHFQWLPLPLPEKAPETELLPLSAYTDAPECHCFEGSHSDATFRHPNEWVQRQFSYPRHRIHWEHIHSLIEREALGFHFTRPRVYRAPGHNVGDVVEAERDTFVYVNHV